MLASSTVKVWRNRLTLLLDICMPTRVLSSGARLTSRGSGDQPQGQEHHARASWFAHVLSNVLLQRLRTWVSLRKISDPSNLSRELERSQSFYQIGSSLRKRKAGLNGLGASLNQDLKRNFRLKPCRERRLVSKASWSQRVKRKSRIISLFGNRVFHV
jgi:hypothetical protein